MNEEERHKKRLRLMWGLGLGFALVGLVIFFLWLFIFRFEETTRDAYVHGNQVLVNSQIPGYVSFITVDETQLVEEDRILVQLDTTDQKIALESAKNTLAEIVRTVAQMFEEASMLKADVEQTKAALSQAYKDYHHRKKLLPIGGVSKEDFQHAETAFISTFAHLLSLQHKLRGALALIENTTLETHPNVEKAKDAFRQAYVNLQRCTIRSPVRGLVAMKKVQVGESIDPETPLMMIIPLDQMWVNANFKEVQLKNVLLGQHVTMKADLYGDEVIYRGKVVGISAGTGSVLSILPPQNATGNWIKIVQRLPVRVNFEPEQLEKYPLRLGLSMHVTIDTHDRVGTTVPISPPPGPLYKTNIFAKQEEWANKLIKEIVQQNTQFSFNVAGDHDNTP